MSQARPIVYRSSTHSRLPELVTEVVWPTFARARAYWRRHGGQSSGRLIIVGDWTVRQVRIALDMGLRVMVHESAPADVKQAARAALLAGGTFVWLPAMPAALSASRPVRSLTSAQLRVMKLVAEGLKSSEIAARLGVSVRTVETHRHHILRRTGLRGGIPFLRLAVSLFPG